MVRKGKEIGGLKKRNRLSFRRILAINIEGMIELANHHYAIPHVMWTLGKGTRDKLSKSLLENRIFRVLKRHPTDSFFLNYKGKMDIYNGKNLWFPP